MTRSRSRRVRAGFAVATAAIAAVLATSVPTAAQEPPPPPPPPVFEGGHELTPLPGYEEYAGCPLLNTGQFRFCIALTINGDIGLGNVGGTIDDLKMVLGVAGGLSGEPVMVPAQGGGGPADVPVSGGILGIPELDPLLELDVLQLLSLSATPQLGELTQTGLDDLIALGVLGFFGYPSFDPVAGPDPILPGEPAVPLPAAGEPFCVNFGGFPQCLGPMPTIGVQLPLTVRLNNLLLGEECTIGPIDLSLTSGTTSPPEGFEPMTGSSGSLARNLIQPIDFHIDGMRLVGNEFAVPGSDCAGILGAGDLTESVGLGNTFETLIDNQAGLPSAAGNNRAELTIDLHVARQDAVYGLPVSFDPASVDFGDVPVGGESDPQTVTVTNTRNRPRVVDARVFTGGTQYVAVANDCGTGLVGDPGSLLAPGESCTITLVFRPSSIGPRDGQVRVNSRGTDGTTDVTSIELPLTGNGT